MVTTLIERISRWVATIGGLALILLVLFIGADVTLRYLFNAPIRGSQEISQLGLVVVVCCSLAYGASTGAHVAIELITGNARWRFWTYWLVAILSLGLLGLATWQSAVNVFDAMEYDDGTALLRIPYAPFYLLLAIALALYMAVLVGQMIDVWRGRLEP